MSSASTSIPKITMQNPYSKQEETFSYENHNRGWVKGGTPITSVPVIRIFNPENKAAFMVVIPCYLKTEEGSFIVYGDKKERLIFPLSVLLQPNQKIPFEVDGRSMQLIAEPIHKDRLPE